MSIAWANLQAGSLVRFQAAGLEIVEACVGSLYNACAARRCSHMQSVECTENTATWANFKHCMDFHSSTFLCQVHEIET